MIDSIVTAIVRPPRARYSLQDLGSKNIRHKGIEYHREDFTIKNNKDFNINGSIWCLSYPSKGDSDSCIIYLHPNSGSRVDVIKTRIMTIAANSKCAVCGFDFAGCGESQGDNISLGVNEKDDLCAILSYLYQKGYKKYILWGRSMGAATAVIFYGAYRELVKGTVLGLVLDSPFTSMQGLAEEYSSTRVGVPSILLSPAVHYLRHTIQTNYNFDLYHMTPIGAAPRIDIPTIVLSGSEDKIVPPKLSEELYEAFAGPKMRIFFQGGHNTHRPSPIYEAIRVFVVGILRGLPVVDVLNMSTEVLKNQLIEFPQFQLPSQNEINTNSNTASNSNLTDNNNNNNNNSNKQEINLQQQQQTVKDRRSSVDSQVDDALQITVESARTLEPLRIIGDIKIETESDNLTPSSSEIFTSIAEEVEKKLSVEEKTESSWSSIPVSSNSDINNNNNKLHNNHKHHHSSNKKHENGHSENGHHENGNGYSNGHGNGHAQPQQQHDRTKKLANQQQKLNQSKPCVYSISIDYGQDDNSSNNSKNEQLPETSTWMGAVGMLFGYSNLSQNQQLSPLIVHSGQYEGSRIGSYGYLMNQIGNTMCPPDKIVWEKLLISRCEEIILDIVCDQLITLSSGLLDYTKSDKPNEISSSLIPPDIPPDERCLLMSMIVAEISSSIGLLSSVGGEETLNWGKLILSSDNELISIISDNESQKILEKKNQMKQIQEENLNKKNEEKFNNIQENNNKNDNNYIKKSDNINKKDGQDKEIRVISIVV